MSLLAGFVKLVDNAHVALNQEKQACSQYEQCLRWQETGEDSSMLPDISVIRALEQYVQRLRQMNEKVNVDLMDQCGKLQVKMTAVDPVTGEARYGQAAQSKFQTAQQLLNDFASDLSSTLLTYDSLLSKLLNAHEAQTNRVNHEAAMEADRLRKEQEQQRMEEQAEQERIKKEQDKREAIALKELHDKAEMIRKQKELEAASRQQFEIEFQGFINSLANRMHCTFGNIPQDVFKKHVQYVKDYCSASNSSNTQRKTAREVVGMIVTILERIIGRPDDSNARKIRITHPVIQGKLTTTPGCLQVLIAIGFRIVAKDTSVEASNHSTSQDNSEAVEKKPWGSSTENIQKVLSELNEKIDTEVSGTITDLSSVLLLLHPHTPYEIFLEMEEPRIDSNLSAISEGKDAWLTWYDGLKEHLTIVQEVLASR